MKKESRLSRLDFTQDYTSLRFDKEIQTVYVRVCVMRSWQIGWAEGYTLVFVLIFSKFFRKNWLWLNNEKRVSRRKLTRMDSKTLSNIRENNFLYFFEDANWLWEAGSRFRFASSTSTLFSYTRITVLLHSIHFRQIRPTTFLVCALSCHRCVGCDRRQPGR